MQKTINLNNPQTIQAAIKALEKLKSQRIPELSERFVNRMLEVGIEVGKANAVELEDLGNVKSLIGFYKRLDKTQYGCDGLLIAEDIQLLTVRWRIGKDKWKSAEVSALLMSEFGSGHFANTDNMSVYYTPINAGQGTFPGQTHAFEPYWQWYDEKGKHKSRGIPPTMPVYNAYLEMEKQITRIGKEVFRGI